jgi:hypothetical protein
MPRLDRGIPLHLRVILGFQTGHGASNVNPRTGVKEERWMGQDFLSLV